MPTNTSTGNPYHDRLWIPCDMCDDFWCTRHQQHVYDCKCPPLEAWIEPPKKSQ